jgi:hypothetical protein
MKFFLSCDWLAFQHELIFTCLLYDWLEFTASPCWLENAESKASSSLEKFDRACEKQLEELSTRYDDYLTLNLTLRNASAKTCPHK